jgi:hypothetical protein
MVDPILFGKPGAERNRRRPVKKIIVSLAFVALATPVFAHGFSQPSLLDALVNVGNHGSIAGVAAKVASPHALADVKANVLGSAVKADVTVGARQPSYDHGYSAPSPSLLGLNVTVPGIARANVDVVRQNRHGSTLLGVTANVLDGGVGRRGGW